MSITLNVNFQMLTISRHILKVQCNAFPMEIVFLVVLTKFPHYWVCFTNGFHECGIELRTGCQKSRPRFHDSKLRIIIVMVWLCIWPGCECHICHLSYILFKPYYEQDVCYTIFCLWKSDKILLSSTMKLMSVTTQI